MSKIKSIYENGIDKVWYDSSNIVYSECDDLLNSLKRLKIVFKGGRSYLYFDVNVNDYLLFRENPSQGSALTRYIKQYKFQQVEDTDIDKLKQELEEIIEKEQQLNDKKALFGKLEEISNNIVTLTNNFKKHDLTNNELSYVSYFINKIIKDLAITNFSEKDINLLEITDKTNAIIESLKTEENDSLINDNLIKKVLKEKLLK